MLLATAHAAHAERVDLEFTSVTAPPKWTQTQDDTATLVFDQGALTTEGRVAWNRVVPLSAATGWTVEVSFAADLSRGGSARLVAADEQQAHTVEWTNQGIHVLDSDRYAPLDDAIHVVRLEVHGGRRRLWVDRKLIDDREATLPLVVSASAGISLYTLPSSHDADPAATAARSPTPRVTWRRLEVDTAPRRITRARKRPPKLVRIPQGPFASEWNAIGRNQPKLARDLAKLSLPGEAALCVAAAVAGVSLARLDHEIKHAEGDLAEASRRPPQCTPARAGDCEPNQYTPRPEPDRTAAAEARVRTLRALREAKDRPSSIKHALALALDDPEAQRRWSGSLIAELRTLERNPTRCR